MLYLKVKEKNQARFQDTKRTRTIIIQISIPGHAELKSRIGTVPRKLEYV
jgi:hypothetical protein